MFYFSPATPCRHLLSLLDNEMFNNTLVTDGRISDSSSRNNNASGNNNGPSQARLSGTGWCSENRCNIPPTREYLEIDFGAELVVEAILIANDSKGFYVTEYMLEYAGSDGMYENVISNASSSTVSST